MLLGRLIILLVAVALICGCEFDDGISQEVRDQADYAISANDPYSCYHLKTENEINWCLNKFSTGTNSTAGCKLILNSSYSNNCVTNLAIETGDWSKCADTLSLTENAKCRALVALNNLAEESEEGDKTEDGGSESSVASTTKATTTTLNARTIQVDGSAAFTTETNKALTLLKGAKEYTEITQNVAKIKEHSASGMNVYANVPTYEVGQTTWQAGTLWYAGTIAHDSYHAKLYNNAKAANGGKEPAANTWTGPAAETKCLNYQIKVLEQLVASQADIDYLKQLAQNPQYQNIPYANRTW